MLLSKIAQLVAGLIVTAYWARVVAMAIRQRRRTGRGANFLPPEPLGRALRILWIPAIVAWITAPFLAAGDAHPQSLFASLYHEPVAHAIGALVAVVAFGLTLRCWRGMGKAWRMGIDPGEKNPLVISGAFAIVRHPIYALSQLMMLGTVVAVASPLILLAAAIHIPLLQWESRREERHMLGIYGQQYADYCRVVNRWWPRWSAVGPSPTGAKQDAKDT
jgi:protein-S-isoprenylcysteine O-methyltransferase Ste14